MTAPATPPELGGLSRTAAAIAWIENGAGPDELSRTAYRAARLFKVSQSAISQERKRRRRRLAVFATGILQNLVDTK